MRNSYYVIKEMGKRLKKNSTNFNEKKALLKMTEDCLFCKIVNKEIPSDILYEDDEILVFLDIYPITKGHALFIPKKHIANLYELKEEEIGFMENLPRIVRKLKDVTGASGMNLIQNNGKDAGQVIFHLHFHLIPRHSDDGLTILPPRSELDKADAEELIHKFIE